MSNNNWSLLSRLRTAVKKVKFLLNLNLLHRWRIASMIGASSSKRLFSFNDRPGLRACTEDDMESFESSPAGSSGGSSLHRTISYPSDQDDIDKRAEMFIANFHKQLQIERQISLQLRYCRANSFGSSMSP